MKKTFIFLLFVLNFFIVFSQDDSTETSLVKWIDLNEAEKLFAQEPKPILIDIYTDWCGWCKHMMKTTYSNPNIAGFINNYFYPVKFNSEKTDSIFFNGKSYTKQGKVNQLAVELLDGRLSYPSTVFLTTSGQKFVVPGYKSVGQIEPYLVYAYENLDKSVSIEDYVIAHMYKYPKNFTEELQKVPQNKKIDTSATSEWFTFDDAFAKATTDSKKYILFSSVSWCYSCKVMKDITFSDSIIAAELKENFYLIDFDAATSQVITINGKEYKSMGQGQPNQLAYDLFQGKFIFPSIIVLDENFELLSVINGYYTAQKLEPILEFFATDAWKTKSYQDFFSTFQSKRN